jgi:hypothetical protein
MNVAKIGPPSSVGRSPAMMTATELTMRVRTRSSGLRRERWPDGR